MHKLNRKISFLILSSLALAPECSIAEDCLHLSGQQNAEGGSAVEYSTCRPADRLLIRVEPGSGNPSSYEFPLSQKSTELKTFTLRVPPHLKGRLVLEQRSGNGNVLEQKTLRLPLPSHDASEVSQEVSQEPLQRRPVPPRSTRRPFVVELRAGPMAFVQLGSIVPTAGLSLNPRIEWNSHLFGGFSVGMAPVRNQLGENFFAADFQLAVGTYFNESWGIELAAGAQTWTQHGGTYPLLTGSLLHRFDYDVARVFNQLFVSFGSYLMKDHYTAEIRAGIGIAF